MDTALPPSIREHVVFSVYRESGDLVYQQLTHVNDAPILIGAIWVADGRVVLRASASGGRGSIVLPDCDWWGNLLFQTGDDNPLMVPADQEATEMSGTNGSSNRVIIHHWIGTIMLYIFAAIIALGAYMEFQALDSKIVGRSKEGFHKADFENWVEEAKRLNPDIKFPPVTNEFDE